MKLKALAEVMMYLPGFGPGENPLEAIPPQATSISMREASATVLPFPAASRTPKVTNQWPLIQSVESAHGQADRIERNLNALRILNQIEAEHRDPTEEERAALNRYSGWGAVPKIFDTTWAPLRNERDELQKLIADGEDIESARHSVNTAFFTPIEVCKAMWEWIKQTGFNGGRILEPSAGTGLLLGTMPQEMVATSTVTAIEKDPTTGRILRALYAQPDTQVHIDGFEKVDLPEGGFDLAISNVPFGNFGVVSAERSEYRKWLIHDFFFGRAMTLVREGGLVAFLTSSGTLDKSNPATRLWLSAHADLVHAVRLPSQSFKAFAGTEASIDFLILRKRGKDEARISSSDWASEIASSFEFSGKNYNAAALPDERFIGERRMVTRQYGGRSSIAHCEGDWRVALATAVDLLTVPACYTPRKVEVIVPDPARESLGVRIKPGSYLVMSNGRVGVSAGNEVVEAHVTKADEAKILSMIPLRDSTRKLVERQAYEEDDSKLEILRAGMGAAYQAFVKSFGPINDKRNVKALRLDPDFPLVLSLEKWDSETGKTTKADLFYRRTAKAVIMPDHAETVQEALQICLAQTGRVIPYFIARLVKQSVEDVEASLLAEGLAYCNPSSGLWESADLYLSGDVKTKLSMASAAGSAFLSNVEALKGVIPEDIKPKDITINLGASWIPCDILSQFVNERLGGHKAEVSLNAKVSLWSMNGYCSPSAKFSTSRISTGDLFVLALNQKEPEIRDRDHENKSYKLNPDETLAACAAQENIREAFSDWIYADEKREARIHEIYNRVMNRYVERKIDGSRLVLPGFSHCLELRQHQKDAIWRIVSGKANTLLAHCVGAGKTLVMICAAMEMRRTGKARKPLIVVPSHMLEQFMAEFLRAYPGASVLAASKDDATKENRKSLVARMTAWSWDAIIMTHSSFGRIQSSPDRVKAFINNELEILTAAMSSENDKKTIKEIESAKSRLNNRLELLATGWGKDDFITLEETGVDHLSVDEAHMAKNLYRFSRMTRIAGLPNSDSQRAFDMLLKVREITFIRNDECGITFATGTPISNSMAELWTMQTFLQPSTLQRIGYEMFDSWASAFGRVVKAVELRPDGGGYRVNARFSKFVNLPELMSVFSEVADIKTKEMLSLPTPITHRVTVVAEGSPTLKAFVQTLVERSESIRAGKVKADVDNMLSVTFDGRCAATDMRLVGGEDEAGSKVNLCVDKLVEVHANTTSNLGTQAVFLDMSTPKGAGVWSLYGDMKEKLIKRGIPPSEIAFIHDASTDAAKEKLFASVRSGKTRILLGSTEKMGVGTNIQKRLVALHHIDAPWKPSCVEQREGRIERQGNENEEVTIYRYVTSGSFDSYMWQCLHNKARFIAQVMSGEGGRSAEDAELSALSYAEVKALASGNPLVLEKAGVDADVLKLEALHRQWVKQTGDARYALRTLPSRIHAYNQLARAQDEDEKAIVDVSHKNFEMVIREEVFTDRKEASRRLFSLMLRSRGNQAFLAGNFAGFEMWIDGSGREAELSLKGQATWDVRVAARHNGPIDAIMDTIRNIRGESERTLRRLDAMNRDLSVARAMMDQGFDQMGRLEELRARQDKINTELGVFEGAKAAIDDADPQAAKAA
ncbi:MAG: RNA polymerase-associated protein RapA [Chloroflexi bacterium]|nr:RNA polymerase-associated protein RapA [Chloroflexota bacterium]